ncbi:MAG TPA: helix-turn-helix transcriptional regulator [Amycolatopsis sp.]|nr:helix-turn-helix transcriptional regulator [Amycolatopsis sp.]
MKSRRDTRKLTTALLASASGTRFHAGELREATGLHNARLYPLLVLFEQRGWLANGWDESESDAEQPRPWYTLTDLGRRKLARP